MPDVSVIIPCYRQANFLAEAIDSALAQYVEDKEVIAINDGSPDHTREVCAGYGDRIVYLEQENGGLSAARNTGIRSARGKYIAFLDSDDIYLPGALKTQRCYLDEHPDIALVCGNAERLMIAQGAAGFNIQLANLRSTGATFAGRQFFLSRFPAR